jgi:hypothetical protein
MRRDDRRQARSTGWMIAIAVMTAVSLLSVPAIAREKGSVFRSCVVQ